MRCAGRIAIALACAVAILAKTGTAGAASASKSGETVAPTPPFVESAPTARASAAASARTAEAGTADDGVKTAPLAGADADMCAEIDPLRSDREQLAQKLKAAVGYTRAARRRAARGSRCST